jgi:hypothetical protein
VLVDGSRSFPSGASDTVVGDSAVARRAPRPAPAGAAVAGGRGARTDSSPSDGGGRCVSFGRAERALRGLAIGLQRPLDECSDRNCAVATGSFRGLAMNLRCAYRGCVLRRYRAKEMTLKTASST